MLIPELLVATPLSWYLLLSAILFPGAAQRLLPRAATPEAADDKDTG